MNEKFGKSTLNSSISPCFFFLSLIKTEREREIKIEREKRHSLQRIEISKMFPAKERQEK